MVIGIIGGGAAGMAAALAAAENEKNQVLVIERQARVGRKLLATGNGRCNLTNLNATGDSYHGEAPEFAKKALEAFSVEDTLAWFRRMGLFTVAEESGRVYPYSDQANSVVDVLRFALNRPNVQLITGTEVTRIKKSGEGFAVQTAEDAFFCDKLIIACGGLAGKKLGGSMAGYKLLRSMGHHVTHLRPALVQLKSDWHGCAGLKGVRANCHVAILHGNELHAESVGEIQFTEYGLSGPVIFEVSRDVCQGSGDWTAKLDLLPSMDDSVLQTELERRREGDLPTEELLTGILHNRLGRVLTASAGIRGNRKLAELSDDEIKTVCRMVKELEVNLTGTLDMDSAQVTAGGILTEEFEAATMESKLVPGLYACGEVLDIDGDCGGYNLQWAWSSGRLAGCAAGGAV